MSKVKVTKKVFKSIKSDLKKGYKYDDIKQSHGLSYETIRLIKKCPDWEQWEQNKVNRTVARSNEKYSKTFIGRIRLFLGV